MAHKGVELCISMAKVGLPTWSRDNSVIESAAKDNMHIKNDPTCIGISNRQKRAHPLVRGGE